MSKKTPEQLLVAVLAASVARAVARIDADVDAIYGAVIGARQAEYELAERQAQAFADAGYEGEAGPMVQSWATVKGWSAQQAADDILSVAAAWRTAQAAIRAQRLAAKEKVRTAPSESAIGAALAAWDGFTTIVRGQLGVGGV